MSFNPLPVGTQLHVETCFGDHITGEVVTYVHSEKMLILRTESKDTQGKKHCDQSIINLNFCKNLEIIKDAPDPEAAKETPARLNLKCLDKRRQDLLVERAALLSSQNELATPRACQLFCLLSRHFGPHELSWQQNKILVLQHMVISPPYLSCVSGNKQGQHKLHGYVQRLVDRFNLQNPIE